MSLDLLWSNLAAYCLQVGLLIGVAAFIPTLLRFEVPRARLAFWHILLFTCLVLPLFAPWRRESITVGASIPVVRTTPRPAAAPAVQRVIPWNQIALGLLALGVVIRLGGLVLGTLKLRQYRDRSVPLEPASSWGVEAEIRISPDVTSPVTFGASPAVILLPEHFRELDQATQEAVLCHEIVHVRRLDWVVILAEELARSIFWFHPAIWWLLGEIGLAREQTVDREVIHMTRAREEYVDALLTMAGSRPQLDLATAPSFLRRRHLKHRVVSIMKEVRMSKTRYRSALAAGVVFLAAACWLVTMTFPLSAQPQMVSDGPGVTVDLGGAAIMHRTAINYPYSARGTRVGGTLLVDVTLDNDGNVADAQVVSGPTELRRSVLQSVLQWHFANDTGANKRQIRITFADPGPVPGRPATVSGEKGPVTTLSETRVAAPGAVIGGIIGSVPSARAGFAGKTLKQINIVGLTDDAKTRLSSRLPVRVGDLLSEDSFLRAIAAVREYDEHLNVSTRNDQDGSVIFTIAAPGANPNMGYAFSNEPQPPVPGRITIGGNVQQSKLVQQPRPVYPPLAKQARISGTVRLAVIIARDGTMQDMKVISGHPLLIPPTLEAVKGWVYQPTLLNGQPVEVATQIDVNFTLSDEIPQQQQ
jgi:TonB family protein